MFSIQQWIVRRWQSSHRYYTAEIVQDLFGGWILRCGWGGLYNRKGNVKEEALSSYDEALTELQKIGKRREQRGYRLV
jgi:predicted DNA-binding WGR domain protein